MALLLSGHNYGKQLSEFKRIEKLPQTEEEYTVSLSYIPIIFIFCYILEKIETDHDTVIFRKILFSHPIVYLTLSNTDFFLCLSLKYGAKQTGSWRLNV